MTEKIWSDFHKNWQTVVAHQGEVEYIFGNSDLGFLPWDHFYHFSLPEIENWFQNLKVCLLCEEIVCALQASSVSVSKDSHTIKVTSFIIFILLLVVFIYSRIDVTPTFHSCVFQDARGGLDAAEEESPWWSWGPPEVLQQGTSPPRLCRLKKKKKKKGKTKFIMMNFIS